MQMRCLFTAFLGSFPGDIPGWWWGTGGGRTQSIFSPLNNARDNLCVSTLWKQMIKKDYQRKRRKSDLGPRSLRSQPFFKVKVGHVLMCCAWALSLSRVWLLPMGCSPPGSSVHGILQARVLEWVAMSSSRGSSQPRDQTQVSHIAGRFFTIWATRINQSEANLIFLK